MRLLPFILGLGSTFLLDEAGGDGGNAGGGAASGQPTETPEQKSAREAADAAKKGEQIDPLGIDIKAALEKARKQEKDKLYQQMQAQDARLKELEENNKKLLEALSNKKAEEKPEPKPENKGEAKGIDEDAITRATEGAFKLAEQKFMKMLEEANGRVMALENQLKSNDISTYKNQLIEANKDAIIPELIVGTTREELDTSLITAKQAFARLEQRFGKLAGKENAGSAAAPTAASITIPTPAVAGQAAPGAAKTVDVSRMSPAEYKSHREALLKAAAAETQRALGNAQA
jgi:hypothetical protein